MASFVQSRLIPEVDTYDYPLGVSHFRTAP
jgi:hypothetical protein